MILVAGGTGRLGRIVVDRLLAPVNRCGSCHGGRGHRQARRAGSLERVLGDIRDRQAVARAVAGARVVVSAVSAFGMKG